DAAPPGAARRRPRHLLLPRLGRPRVLPRREAHRPRGWWGPARDNPAESWVKDGLLKVQLCAGYTGRGSHRKVLRWVALGVLVSHWQAAEEPFVDVGLSRYHCAWRLLSL